MSEHYTRADWRPGKRRKSQPRVRDWGGNKKAPPAFLAMSRLVGLDTMTARRCEHCGRVAMKGLAGCMRHNGARWTAQRRPYVPRCTAIKHEPAPEPVT